MGGTPAGAIETVGNLISGNSQQGVVIEGLGAEDNSVRGRMIWEPSEDLTLDATASYRKGAWKGPAAILRASHQVELYDLATGEVLEIGPDVAAPGESGKGAVPSMSQVGLPAKSRVTSR